MFFVWIAEFGEFKSLTKYVTHIMLPIFILSVINYVFMPIISTWDFKNMTEDDLQVSQGVYKDFNSNWFLDAGEVVITTMQFNILMPPIEFLLAWAFRYLFRAWD